MRMIKNVIKKLLTKKKTKSANVRYIGVAEHKIDTKLVNENARTVVKKLRQAGYEAFIVGGAVRDLLLHQKPKDFDVATNATPEQVKACFKRAFIIGKRFRLVHVVFGYGRQDRGRSEVIEVSTFRALYINANIQKISAKQGVRQKDLREMKLAIDSQGRVLRDNVWGSQEEDAARRDFTVNAMYYDPERELVVDFHDGFVDLKNKVIRIIGDPTTRYREDPVRILRALRFAAKYAKLGFSLERCTQEAIATNKALLKNIPFSRLFDETLKLLQTGHARDSVAEMVKLQLHQGTYPLLELLGHNAQQPMVQAALRDTDERVAAGKSLTASFIMAVLLWDKVLRQWQANLKEMVHQVPALLGAIDSVFSHHIGDIPGRGRLVADMREIWLQQPRLEARAPRSVRSMVLQPRFRAAFDFFLLRAQTGEVSQVLAAWWSAYVAGDSVVREDMLQELRRTRAKKKAVKQPTVAVAKVGAEDADAESKPKRRRRRRRKPANAPATAVDNASVND